MLRFRPLTLTIPLLCLAFMGFGCKKQTSGFVYPLPLTTNTPSISPTTTPPVYVKDPKKPRDEEHGTDPNILLLRQVMKNLITAKSFRAKMTIPTDAGAMGGDIEFARGKGLHGVLTLPNQSTTEIYLVGQDILFRANTSSWSNLAFTPEGTRMAALFGSAFSLQGNGTTSTISDSATILTITDDPTGCKLYALNQPIIGTRSVEKIQICVKDNLPQYFKAATQAGDVQVSYRDFNQTIPIVSPIKK